MERILIETHGCTLNRADSGIMRSVLESKGFEVDSKRYSYSEGGYDYVIVNTCTVKKQTEQRITERLGRMRALGKRLVVTGCMASANSDMIAKVVPEASIVGTSRISEIGDVIEDLREGGKSTLTEYVKGDKLANYVAGKGRQVIARIPVSEGCISSCSFCETKFARGPLNSFSEELILRAAKMSIDSGAKEIELTSQDMGAYGLDRRTNVAKLSSALSSIEGEFRIRIGMLNPEHLYRYIDDLIYAYNNGKLFKFIHLPVQSGSDSVLRKMGRRYTSDEFRGYARELREKVNGMNIETDIIIGYPAESEDDFAETVNLLEDVKPDVTNLSKFSRRPHAPASRIAGLDNSVIKSRSIMLSRMVRRMQHEEYSRFVGTVRRVLITEENRKSYAGRDDSYRAVAVTNIDDPSELGRFIDVRVTGNSYACLISSALHG